MGYPVYQLTYEYLRQKIYNCGLSNDMVQWYLEKLNRFKGETDPERRLYLYNLVYQGLKANAEARYFNDPLVILGGTIEKTIEDLKNIGEKGMDFIEKGLSPWVLIPIAIILLLILFKD